MPLDRASAIRLAAIVAGFENHDERIRRDAEYAYAVTKSPELLREYHATLGIANRLELLARDASPPVTFDTLDLADGSLRPPFLMLRSEEVRLLKLMRACLSRSPIAKVEITAAREVVLHGYVYDEQKRKSLLEPVAGSEVLFLRRAG